MPEMQPRECYALSPATRERVAASDRRIVVTGAGGWLGLATLDLLHEALGPTFATRTVAFGSSARPLLLRDGTGVDQRPLDHLRDLPSMPTLILHFAFLTKDRADTMDEAVYRAANRALSATVLGSAEPIGAQAVFVASSGAAGIVGDPRASSAARLYGELKQADEDAFAAWAAQTGHAAVIARIFNVAGPYINKHDAYALASFIVDALSGGPVRVRATRPVWRSYVAVRELMSLVLALLLDPAEQIVRFDTAGETPLEMRAIAARVAAIVGDGRVEAADPTGDGEDVYVGERQPYAALLTRHDVPTVPFDDQVRETANDIALTLR